MQSAFEFLWPLHQRGGTAKRKRRRFDDEYEPQLRKIDSADWAKKWRTCWGSDEESRARDFGEEWENPFHVLAKTRSIEAELFCGGVHGDLHPKNIVFSRDTPTIIDFGWAKGDAHIAKDFVLFECNVRFVTLPASVSYHEVDAVSSWISFDEEAPKVTCPDLRGRLELVSLLRAKARRAFPDDTNWDLEYVVPMFMVAIGLLKHSNDFSSQVSARRHVLRLAQYVAERVLPKYETKQATA
jgi:serine/threonine protein kinase